MLTTGHDDESRCQRMAQCEQISTAIDQWASHVGAVDEPAFSSEAERLAFFHIARRRAHEAWTNPKRCMFPGCVAHSIPRSHTLPRSGPLALVAENGHVVTPSVTNGGDVRIQPLGIGRASTFPGFCSSHEAEFRELEQAKDLDGDRSWALQFFRTVWWEIRVLEHWRERIKEQADAYDRALRARASGFLRERLGCGVEVSKLCDSERSRERSDKALGRIESLLSSHVREFLEPLRSQLCGGDPPLEAFITTLDGPVLPVCLAGWGNFHCATTSGVVTVPVFLQVFPTSAGTKLGLLATKDGARFVSLYISTFMRHEFGALDMIEAWMIHGTDHWFLRPSVWSGLTPDRRARIEAEFMNENLSIGERTAETIFDHLRS